MKAQNLSLAPSLPEPCYNQSTSPIEKILFYLALNTMKAGGHRYGSFLDAASTAAKLALFHLYEELDKNINQTGLLYHVESKRVKAIVKSIEEGLIEGQSLTSIQSRTSYYLIALPHLWLSEFPCDSNESWLRDRGFSAKEKQQIEAQLPATCPKAKILDQGEFDYLLEKLHQLSQQSLPEEQRLPFSNAILRHINFQLLHSKTITRIHLPAWPIPLFALARQSYSPQKPEERALTMIEDVATYFTTLQDWVNQERGVMRAVETLEIAPHHRDLALQELDEFLKAWADKYHQEGGDPIILQAAIGDRRDHP